MWGRFSATGIGTVVRIREANLISAPSLLPCFCVSLLILPHVVMSVCRRCVGRVDVEMGGKAGIWVECVGQSKNAHKDRLTRAYYLSLKKQFPPKLKMYIFITSYPYCYLSI